MNANEIETLTNVVYTMFGRKIGLSKEKIKKCVVAIVNLNDEEINTKLRTLL